MYYYIKTVEVYGSLYSDVSDRHRKHKDGYRVVLEGGITRDEVFDYCKRHNILCSYNLNGDSHCYYLCDTELQIVAMLPEPDYGPRHHNPLPLAEVIIRERIKAKESIF